MKRTSSIVLCLFVLIMFSGCLSSPNYGNETEATEYLGTKLTPISDQGNNAIKGTQFIDKDTYRLQIDGMVERPINLTYDQIIAYTPISKVVKLNCVEGWSFTAKWTGIPVKTLLDETGIKQNATTVIFYSVDGYSTSHDLNYLLDNNIMLAYKINDVTLPPDRGFPLQLVAESKYGYKWAKWINHIELVNTSYKGYWESRGYNNEGDFGGPPFEQ
jgi:DMSO/TMAO reductase YedYZ molybdopterin-dependent catalytic subunit